MNRVIPYGIWGAAVLLSITGVAWAVPLNFEQKEFGLTTAFVSDTHSGNKYVVLQVKDLAKEMASDTANQIQPTVREAIKHARKAVNAGEKGDTTALVAHVQTALSKAKDAQRAGHNEYLNEGVYELGEAIEHGRKNHTEDATEHVRHAIMRLSQSANLQIPE